MFIFVILSFLKQSFLFYLIFAERKIVADFKQLILNSMSRYGT